MAQRKQEVFEERRQQILDGALRAFSQKGFEQATNKDIAEAAGIGSPGLIYHYFKDKNDLFRQVIENRMPVLQLVAKPEELMDLPVREVMLRVGRAYLGAAENSETASFLRLVFSEVIRNDEVAGILNDIGPNVVLKTLTMYLTHKMEVGEIRRADPRITARCLFSPFLLFMLAREVLRQPEMRQMDPETYLAQATDLFLHGILP